ncbi:NADH-quinone oxidoreductase chain M [Proteus mirabilis]|uniref:NADH-quinone oxidoreductase chain M n=1 Tax=Proteus mirabilis TaxID=584 RepID=A0A379GG24_PROMI|nr:NADH-quinone oxidoreductase chain M [Proteus mirabilis]
MTPYYKRTPLLGSELQFILMLGFFAAFAVKMANCPRSWLAS